MSNQNTGGPAFPTGDTRNAQLKAFSDKSNASAGMTLRDYFAAKAPEPTADWLATMSGMERSRNPHNEDHKPALRSRLQLAAAFKFEYADAMLAERSK